MRAPVIVTRPAEPGQRLTSDLQRRGREAVWWPAFRISGPDDEAAVRQTLAGLADYDLALFVSPNAVHATAERLAADWPSGTAIGAVGAATRDAAMAELPGAAHACVVAPDEGDESGSEGFWRAWQASGRHARRVLLLRAATGRDWIVEQLRGAGASVQALPIYDRTPYVLAPPDLLQLRGWVHGSRAAAVVVSSAEAVSAIIEQARAVEGAAEWLKRGIAVATHPRVAQRLHSAGFQHVEVCDADDSSVIRKLESIQG